MVQTPIGSHLLDERSDPDFRTLYSSLLRRAHALDVAIHTPRLAGITLSPREIAGPSRIRIVLAELRILTTAAEADALSATPTGRATLATLIDRFDEGSLEIRSAPLAGWSPDFSIFHEQAGTRRLLMGLHWFVHPYPHRGPALAALHDGAAADRVADRFLALWSEAHDISPPLRRIFRRALDIAPSARHPRAEVVGGLQSLDKG